MFFGAGCSMFNMCVICNMTQLLQQTTSRCKVEGGALAKLHHYDFNALYDNDDDDRQALPLGSKLLKFKHLYFFVFTTTTATLEPSLLLFLFLLIETLTIYEGNKMEQLFHVLLKFQQPSRQPASQRMKCHLKTKMTAVTTNNGCVI